MQPKECFELDTFVGFHKPYTVDSQHLSHKDEDPGTNYKCTKVLLVLSGEQCC